MARERLRELRTLSDSIAALGLPLGLQLKSDYAAAANQSFRRVAGAQGHSDEACLREALAATHAQLSAQAAFYTEAVTAWWEAVAAILEAEVMAGEHGMR